MTRNINRVIGLLLLLKYCDGLAGIGSFEHRTLNGDGELKSRLIAFVTKARTMYLPLRSRYGRTLAQLMVKQGGWKVILMELK